MLCLTKKLDIDLKKMQVRCRDDAVTIQADCNIQRYGGDR